MKKKIRRRRQGYLLLEAMLGIFFVGFSFLAINKIRMSSVQLDAVSNEAQARSIARRSVVERINQGSIGDSNYAGVLFQDRLSNRFAVTGGASANLSAFPAQEAALTTFPGGLYRFRLVHLPFTESAGWSLPLLKGYLVAFDANTAPTNALETLDSALISTLLPPVNMFPAQAALLGTNWPVSNFIRSPSTQPFDGYVVIRWTTDGTTATIGSLPYPTNLGYFPWNYPRFVSAMRDFIFPEKMRPSPAISWENPWPVLTGFRPTYYEGQAPGDTTGPVTDGRLNLFQIVGVLPVVADITNVNTIRDWVWLYYPDAPEYTGQPVDALPNNSATQKTVFNYLTISRASFYATGTATVNWRFVPRNPSYRSDKTINGQSQFTIEPLTVGGNAMDFNNQADTTFQPVLN